MMFTNDETLKKQAEPAPPDHNQMVSNLQADLDLYFGLRKQVFESDNNV